MSQRRQLRRSRSGSLTLAALILGIGLLLVAAVALAGRSGGGRASTEVTGQPRLRVDRASQDLGEVRLGTTVEASFVLTNVGDQPLELTQAPYIEVIEGC